MTLLVRGENTVSTGEGGRKKDGRSNCRSVSDPPHSSRRHRDSLLVSTWRRDRTEHQSGCNLQGRTRGINYSMTPQRLIVFQSALLMLRHCIYSLDSCELINLYIAGSSLQAPSPTVCSPVEGRAGGGTPSHPPVGNDTDELAQA